MSLSMSAEAMPISLEQALASLAELKTQSEILGRHESQMSTTRETLSSKTVLLEELRSEKRILLAEREDAIQRLLEIQSDLEEILVMEEKLNAESQSLEDELVRKMEHPECVQAREQIDKLRQTHNLPELPRIARTRDEETAQYLQARLNEHRGQTQTRQPS